MFRVIKKQGMLVQAYRLGDSHPVLNRLMEEKKLVERQDGRFELFSREILAAGGEHGEIAEAGDWLRLDSGGYPYPNRREWFARNLRHISGDTYEQLPIQRMAWTPEEPMSAEVEFLIQKKGLKLDESDPEHYYRAVLFGSPEAAAKNAVLIFYSITYAADGSVQDAEFNFVERSEFDAAYERIKEE